MKQFLPFAILLTMYIAASAQTVTLSVNQPGPLQIDAGTTVFNILQGESQILGNDITLSGGTALYQVSWSSAAWGSDSVQSVVIVSPADTTTYTCTVTDASGCTTEQPFLVNVVFPVVLEATANQVSCYGKQNGSITLNVSGGAKPYTINWVDGSSEASRTGLGAGTYAVTVTDAMNQQQDTTITLVEQAQIEVALTASVCEGNSYSFNNEELTTEGSYTATFQSVDGCDSVVTVSLTVNPVFETTETAAICQGETYPFAGEDLTVAGKYNNNLTSVTGCDSIVTLNLTVNPLPGTPVITQSGNTLSSSAATGNQWWKDGAELMGETGSSLEIATSGNYSVTVTSDKGCSSPSATYNATYTGIDSYETTGIRCNVYPNPNNGLFTVEVETNQSEIVQLELVAVDGKTIARKQLDNTYGKQTIQFGKENLPKGVYTLRLHSGAKTVNKKLVVN